MLKTRTMRRHKYVTGAEKIHTSIYLLPRHRAHLEFLMTARGTSMTDCICWLIDQSIREYQSEQKKWTRP